MKKMILLFALLTGCSTATQDKPAPTIVHPERPAPIHEFSTEWTVVDIKGQPHLALPWADSQKLRIWLEDIKRYVQQSNVMLCYYRTDLKEPQCVTK